MPHQEIPPARKQDSRSSFCGLVSYLGLVFCLIVSSRCHQQSRQLRAQWTLAGAAHSLHDSCLTPCAACGVVFSKWALKPPSRCEGVIKPPFLRRKQNDKHK